MLVAVFRFVLCLSMCCYPFYFVLFVSVFRVRLDLSSPAYHLLCFALSCCALLLCCLVLFCGILAVFPWFAFALVCFAFLCLFCSVPISFALLCSILLRRALFRLVFVASLALAACCDRQVPFCFAVHCFVSLRCLLPCSALVCCAVFSFTGFCCSLRCVVLRCFALRCCDLGIILRLSSFVFALELPCIQHIFVSTRRGLGWHWFVSAEWVGYAYPYGGQIQHPTHPSQRHDDQF